MMIEYLNANQGAAMVLLTFVYVVATSLLVRYSLQQAKFTQQSLELFQAAERNRYRPYVIFDIIWEDCVASAVVRNSGASSAIDVRIKVTPCLEWKDQKRQVSFIETGIAYLAPNRELTEPFSWTSEFHEGYAPYVFTGNVTYSDSAGSKYNESFLIDIAYTQRMTSIGKPDTPRDIEKIREAMQSIASDEFQPLV